MDGRTPMWPAIESVHVHTATAFHMEALAACVGRTDGQVGATLRSSNTSSPTCMHASHAWPQFILFLFFERSERDCSSLFIISGGAMLPCMHDSSRDADQTGHGCVSHRLVHECIHPFAPTLFFIPPPLCFSSPALFFGREKRITSICMYVLYMERCSSHACGIG